MVYIVKIMHIKKPSSLKKSSKAFTLVELLVVITIIGILMALAVPAVGKALESARRTEALAFMVKLKTGLIQYQSEYRDFPLSITNSSGFVDATSDAFIYDNDQVAWMQMIDVLRANTNNPTTAVHVTNSNKRFLTFVEIEPKYLEPLDNPLQATTLSDPFGHGYNLAFDYNYDNIIEGLPNLSSGQTNAYTNMSQVALWSYGGQTNTDTASVKRWLGTWK